MWPCSDHREVGDYWVSLLQKSPFKCPFKDQSKVDASFFLVTKRMAGTLSTIMVHDNVLKG